MGFFLFELKRRLQFNYSPCKQKVFNALEEIYLTWVLGRFIGFNGMLEGCWHLGNPSLLFHDHLFMVPTEDCSPLAVHSFRPIKLSLLCGEAL